MQVVFCRPDGKPLSKKALKKLQKEAEKTAKKEARKQEQVNSFIEIHGHTLSTTF